MEPIVVEVLRGDVVESRHRVHAAAVRDGELLAGAGDPYLVTFFRSAAKPIQALPLVRARADCATRRSRSRVRRTSPVQSSSRTSGAS